MVHFFGETKTKHYLLNFKKQLIKVQVFTWLGFESLEEFECRDKNHENTYTGLKGIETPSKPPPLF